jgi:O-antigen/teichoic acid export membrane protein
MDATFDARATAWNAALIVIQRGILAAGALLFAALVPRMMGPEMYGRYALLASLATWSALLSGLGLTGTMSRYLPSLTRPEKAGEFRTFVGSLLALRFVSGGVAGALYLGLTLAWLVDLSPVVFVLLAGAVWVQALGNFFFGVTLALNRAARWAAGDTLRRWLLLGLLPPGYWFDGLRGACLAVLVTEVLLLGVGMSWSGLRLSRLDLRPRAAALAPHFRFGLVFLATHVLYAAFHASGEPLVRAFSGDYAQVGYFGLAHNAYLAGAGAVAQLTLAFVPLLGGLHDRGETEPLRQWVDRLHRLLAVTGVLVAFGGVFLADALVDVVFGVAYRSVAPNLRVLALAFLPLGIGSVTSALTLVYDRPTVALGGSAVRLAIFWAAGPWLVTHWGSLGGCVAVLAGSTLHALLVVWRMRDRIGPAPRAWGVGVALGVPFLPLVWLRSSPLVDVVLWAGAVAGYGSLLLLARRVTPAELREIGRVLVRRAAPAGSAGSRPAGAARDGTG